MSAEIGKNVAVASLPRRLLDIVDKEIRTEEEIDQMFIQLRIKRNSMQTVLRLPLEILSLISLEYVAAIRATKLVIDRSRSNPLPQPNRWIRIAHICHYWRVVALNTPRLWASFDVTSPRLVQRLLERSKAILLSVKGVYITTAHRASLKQILDAASRIQDIDLEIVAREGFSLEDLRPNFPREAANLRTVSLRPAIAFDRLLVTPLIFDTCELPALTSLTLRDIPFHWTGNLLAPSLTQLVIETNIAEHEEILIVLEKMPRLRRLELILTRGDVGSLPPPQNHQVSLPKLNELRLSGFVTTCSSLLSQLEYPPTAFVALFIRDGSLITLADELVPMVLTKFSQSMSPIVSASILHQTTPYPGIYLGLWTEKIWPDTLFNGSIGMGIRDPNIPPIIQIGIRSDSSDVDFLLSRMGDFVPYIHTIVYHVPWKLGIWSSLSWTTASQTLQYAESLALDSGTVGVNFFFTALRKNMSTEDRPAFPSLKTLRISSYKFVPAMLQDFLTTLKRRREAQLGLQRLELASCRYIVQADVVRFREFVDIVDWDEHVNFDPSDDEESEDDAYGGF